jgi:voltage-gated potassium channel
MAKTYTQREKEKKQHRRDLLIVGFITVLVLCTGTFFFHFVERMSLVDAFYFSAITLTTVGYGDLTPHTDLGKLFTVGYVIIGIGIIATFARLVLQSAFARRLRHDQSE